ncbi:MAG TPA: HDOD domain-containing protein [Chromatiaceae bacterium]|nr:HDOD domain-containing protein [Chromatiaceae bacterium]
MQTDVPAPQNIALDFLTDFAHQLGKRDIDLPPFPDVYAKILNALNDPDVPLDQLARMVTAAPDLCVRILLVANSALMNRAGVEITDINVAVTRLGVTAVRNATVSIASKELFDIPRNSPLRQKLDVLRAMSLKTAAYAYALAGRSDQPALRDDAMLTGLLHNVGSFYIITKTEQFPEFANEELCHTWMPGIGSALIDNWGFAEEISKAVDEQNTVEQEHFDPVNLRDILIVSKLLAEMHDSDHHETALQELAWEKTPPLSRLGFTAENIADKVEESADEVQSFISALS